MRLLLLAVVVLGCFTSLAEAGEADTKLDNSFDRRLLEEYDSKIKEMNAYEVDLSTRNPTLKYHGRAGHVGANDDLSVKLIPVKKKACSLRKAPDDRTIASSRHETCRGNR